jgi:hypothetical protein
MKKLLKFILFVAIIVLIVIILNRYVPSAGITEKIKVDSLILNQNKIESVTLGRSHAASLNYAYWDMKGINFALGGRDIAGIDYQVDYIVHKLPYIREILISISYSSLYFDNEALSHGNLNDARKALYYSIPSGKLIDRHDINNYVFGKFFPFIQADHGYSLIKQRSLNVMSIINDNWSDTYMDSVQITQSAKKQAYMHSKDRKIAEAYNPLVVEKNTNYLINIVNKAQEHGIHLIFFTSPYYRDYTTHTPEKDILEMKNIMYSLADKYNVVYMDFSQDTLISNNNEYYFNADHLNGDGKRLFTQRLLMKLKEMKIK